MPPRADHPLLRPVLSRLHRTVEDQLGVPCELHLAERDLLRAALVRQPVPQVDLHADDVPLGDTGARITTLWVKLDDVALHGPRLRPEVTAGRGRFVATFLDEAIDGLVDLPPVVDHVWLLGDGLRVNTVAGVAVTCDLGLEGSQVVVRPRLPEPLDRRLPWRRLAHPVPDLPFGATLETLEVDRGQVVATGSLNAEHLQCSVGSVGSVGSAGSAGPAG